MLFCATETASSPLTANNWLNGSIPDALRSSFATLYPTSALPHAVLLF
jgi:hypothetical protein